MLLKKFICFLHGGKKKKKEKRERKQEKKKKRNLKLEQRLLLLNKMPVHNGVLLSQETKLLERMGGEINQYV